MRSKKIVDVPLVDSKSMNGEDEDDVDYVPVYIRRNTRAIGPRIVRMNKPKHLTET